MTTVWTQGQPSPYQNGPYIETAVNPEQTEALVELAAGLTVLEVGAAFGHSAIAMALGGATVFAVDHHREYPGSLGTMLGNIAAYGVRDRVVPVLGATQRVLPALVSGGMRFDMAFVDGDHHEEPVLHDAALCWELIRPGSWMACHDYGAPEWPGVARALDQLHPDGPDRVVGGTLWMLRKGEQ